MKSTQAPKHCSTCGVDLKDQGYTIPNNRPELAQCERCVVTTKQTNFDGKLLPAYPKHHVFTGKVLAVGERSHVHGTQRLWQAFCNRTPYPR